MADDERSHNAVIGSWPFLLRRALAYQKHLLSEALDIVAVFHYRDISDLLIVCCTLHTLTSVRSASRMSNVSRSASLRSTLDNLASSNIALMRSAPSRSAPRRSALLRSASRRSAPCKFASVRSTP